MFFWLVNISNLASKYMNEIFVRNIFILDNIEDWKVFLMQSSQYFLNIV